MTKASIIQEKRTVSVRMSSRLKQELEAIQRDRQMKFSQLLSWLLEIILPIAQREKRFLLMPKRYDDEVILSSHPNHAFSIPAPLADFLARYASEGNRSVSDQICLLLQVGVEYHRRFNRQYQLLRTEEFIRSIEKDLASKWKPVVH